MEQLLLRLSGKERLDAGAIALPYMPHAQVSPRELKYLTTISILLLVFRLNFL